MSDASRKRERTMRPPPTPLQECRPCYSRNIIAISARCLNALFGSEVPDMPVNVRRPLGETDTLGSIYLDSSITTASLVRARTCHVALAVR